MGLNKGAPLKALLKNIKKNLFYVGPGALPLCHYKRHINMK
jgi:hypothetical protein